MAQAKEGSSVQKAATGALDLLTGSKPAETLAELKAGEILVHIFIEETRGLKNPKAADSTVDPIITVKAFGKSRYSKVQKNIGSGATFWGDHYFFEKNFDTTFELENERILISVGDHNLIGYDGVIGNVEINIPTIYYKEGHVMQHQWAALSGLTQNFQEVLGFIKFSVGVFAPGDVQAPLNEEPPVDAAVAQTQINILYPPQIITQSYQILVRVIRGEKLKKMDTFGKCDPYIQVLYGGLNVKSTILKVTHDPVWNEDLYLPISLPTVNNKIIIRLFDWDSDKTTDELMGSVYFDIKDIMDKKVQVQTCYFYLTLF
jgi:Ca2+-dependent lipid-binding protein